MRKFRFRFAPVLEHRKNLEEAALRGLASAQREHQLSIAHKARLVARLESSLGMRESLGAAAAVEALHFRVEQDFITGQKQRVIQAEQGITRANRGVEKALRAFLAARRQTRMIERLYEKDYDEWKRELRKIEQKRMDELTVIRWKFHERNDDSKESA